MIVDRVIIGGGLSGLLEAQDALGQSKSVLLLEAAQGLGGALSPLSVDGVVVDGGAEAFSTATAHFREFVEDAGLGHLVEYPEGTGAHIFSSSGQYALPAGVMGVPTSLDGLADQGIISPEGVAHACSLDSQPWPQTVSEWTVAELIRERLGQEFLERLVRPVLLGIQGSAPESLSASAIFGGLISRASATGGLISGAQALRGKGESMGHAVATLRGGLHQVTLALADDVLGRGAVIKTNTPVQSVRKNTEGFRIETEGGHVQANSLTVATGPRAARELLSEFSELARMLASFAPTSSALVTVSVESGRLSDAPVGSGALISEDVGLAAKATTHLSAKWRWIRESLPGQRHLVRFGFGKDGQLPDESLKEHAFDALESVYQVSREQVRAVEVTQWPDTLIQMDPTHGERVVGAGLLALEAGIALRGAYLTGNGVNGLVRSRQLLREGQHHGH